MKKTTGKLVEIAGKQHYLSVGKVHHGQHLGKYQLSWLPSGPPSPRWIWYLLKVSWPLLAPGSVLRPLGHVLQQDLPALGKKGETSPVGTNGFAQVQFRPSLSPNNTLEPTNFFGVTNISRSNQFQSLGKVRILFWCFSYLANCYRSHC